MDASPEQRLHPDDARQVLDIIAGTLTARPGCVRPRKTGADATGVLCKLDGEYLIKACLSDLPPGKLSATEFLNVLSRMMELSKYIRHGGIRSMIYRMETGKRQVLEDYLDELADQLSFELANSQLRPVSTSYTLLARLKEIDPAEEEVVHALMNDLDHVLIEISRRIDPDLEKEFASTSQTQSKE